LKEGAKDFLTKPLNEIEVLLRINNLLETRFYSSLLEQRVKERTKDLEKARMEVLQRLALAAEYRDDNTGQHTRRVGQISALVAANLNLPAETVELIQTAAPLHDVGKIGIPDSILHKPGKLTEEEFAVMKTHTKIGASILSGGTSPMLQLSEEIAMYHHERWDGRGYEGISGDAIPIAGRIVSVADVFDALTHSRPYKEAWTTEDAVAEISRQSGTQFDPQVVDAFMKLSHADLV
jgi:putative two-component system response regulator